MSLDKLRNNKLPIHNKREQPSKVTPTELAEKICRLLRIEGTTPTEIELSLLKNADVLVSRVEESNPDTRPKQEGDA